VKDRPSAWTITAVAGGGLSLASVVAGVVISHFPESCWLYLVAVPLFAIGLVAAIGGSLKRRRGSRIALVVFVAAIAAGGIPYLIKISKEHRRVDECVKLVERQLSGNAYPAITERWGNLVRIEGRGYEYPPFMSPGGDYFVARRTVQFERGKVSLKVYMPGLSQPLPVQAPGISIEAPGNVIVANF